MIDLSKYESGKKYDGNYDEDLKTLQDRMAELQSLHILHGARTLIVIEGWDAAGKGGAIKRMTATLDPRYYQVYPISAPTAGGEGQAFPLAVLEQAARQPRNQHLGPKPLWPRAGRARRRLLQRGRMAARL